MRAVVTGGAGFIGSHVVEALLARGDEVHVLDNLSRGKRERVAPGAELHVGDIRDPDASFDAVRPEAVFHLAAQADVRLSVEQPEVDADVNVLGTVRILEAARRHGAKVIFSSTGGAIYGECSGPAAETAERKPLAPYGTSKLCAEEYLATWNRLHGTEHVSLRFANVYGPRQEPHGEAGVVAIFMGLLHEGGTPRIYGDGSQTRDYVFVEDAVGAMLARARQRRRRLQRRHRGRDVGARAPRCDPARERDHKRAGVRRGAPRRAATERARHHARRTRARLASRPLARRGPRADVGLDRAGVERSVANRFGPCNTPSRSRRASPGAAPPLSSARSRRSSSWR